MHCHPRFKNDTPSLSALTSVGLAPLKTFIAAPFPMQQAMMIWKACTANDPIQEDEDDRAANADPNGNKFTSIMVVVDIAPIEAATPAPIQLSMTPVITMAEFEPLSSQGMSSHNLDRLKLPFVANADVVKAPEDQVTTCTISAVKTVVEYEPLEAILPGINEPKAKVSHARTDSVRYVAIHEENITSPTHADE